VANKKHLFTQNLEVHNHNTRSANNFQLPIVNLTKYQKKELILQELKFFNHLPTHIKYVAKEIQVFRSALKRFLLSNSFYSNEEYFDSNN